MYFDHKQYSRIVNANQNKSQAMLNHTAANKWQDGLMKLIGCMEMKYWNLLWAMALDADDNGFTKIMDKEIENATLKRKRRYYDLYRNMRNLGLVRIVVRRKVAHIAPGKPEVIQHRILQIYGGIQYGVIPEHAAEYMGLCPAYFMRGRKVVWQTHKLFRDKFKSTPL